MKKQILSIHQTSYATNLVKTLLKEEGYDVVSCNSLNKGHSIAKKQNPDLILIDSYDKDETLSLLEVLKKDKITNKIPVIMVTNQEKDILKNKVNDIIEKPIDILSAGNVLMNYLH